MYPVNYKQLKGGKYGFGKLPAQITYLYQIIKQLKYRQCALLITKEDCSKYSRNQNCIKREK